MAGSPKKRAKKIALQRVQRITREERPQTVGSFFVEGKLGDKRQFEEPIYYVPDSFDFVNGAGNIVFDAKPTPAAKITESGRSKERQALGERQGQLALEANKLARKVEEGRVRLGELKTDGERVGLGHRDRSPE